MPIDLSCPSCGQAYQFPDHAAGKVRSCTSCGEAFHIPNSLPVYGAFRAGPMQEEIIACPHCATSVRLPPRRVGQAFRCPRCKHLLEGPPAEPAELAPDDDLDDERAYQVGRRRHQPQSNTGRTCSILSVIFGCIAFLLCPPFFGLAGLILGITGVANSEEKGLGIVGIVLSVVGAIVGMILGFLIWRGM